MSFESYSQAGQDRFVWEILDRPCSGTFIDVGSGHARDYSNTYGLEQKGWIGFLIDRFHWNKDPSCADIARRGVMLEGEASEMLRRVAEIHRVKWADYLSIDVDGDSGKVLSTALDLGIGYGVITIEHDWYLRGKELRDLERHLLRAKGYDLVCEGVSWGQGPFEDWWAHPQCVSPDSRDKFRCRNRWWRDIPHIMDDL